MFAMQKAAKDVEECKEMLVNVQRQLDRIEEKQDKMVRDGRFNGSLLERAEDEDEAMRDGRQREAKTDKKTPLPSTIKKVEENSSEESSDEEEDEEEVEEKEKKEEVEGVVRGR